jgi:cupin-like protein
MARTLERISAEDFLGRRPELIAHNQPILIDGLCRGQKLAAISDPLQARALLGTTSVSVGPNYVDTHLTSIRRFQRGRRAATKDPLPRRRMQFTEYLALIEKTPDVKLQMSEEPTPAEMLDQLDLSALGITSSVSGSFASLPATSATSAQSFMFAAGPGAVSDLHYDGDGRDVVLYHGFGRKRVVVFPPRSSPLLHPIDVYSTIGIRRMGEAQLNAFLDYADGQQHWLQPGEAIFIPAFTWHYFGYAEFALSINFRFAGVENEDAKWLARSVHRDQCIQNILAGTRQIENAELYSRAAHELRVAAEADYGSAREKYRVIRALARSIYEQTGTDQCANHPAGVVEAEDFLDGALCAYYRRPARANALKRFSWRALDLCRHELRRLARRIAYWA